MRPFRPLDIPSFSYSPTQLPETIRGIEDARLARQKQSEVERSALVDEGLRGRHAAVAERGAATGENQESRMKSDFIAKLKEGALGLYQQGKHVEAEQIWGLTGEPAPWDEPAPTPAAPSIPGMLKMPSASPDMDMPPAPPEPTAMDSVDESLAAFGRAKDAPAPSFDMELAPMTAGPGTAGPPAPPEPGAAPMMAEPPKSLPGMLPSPPAPAEPPQSFSNPEQLPQRPVGMLGGRGRLEQQTQDDTASVVGMLDKLLANEGAVADQGLAKQVRAMAADAAEAARRSGMTPMDAAVTLLGYYNSNKRVDATIQNTQMRVDAQKKKGGGGGAKGPPSAENFKEVFAVAKEIRLQERSSQMNDAAQRINSTLALAESPNALGQVQAIAQLVKTNFGGQSSNTELNTILNAGGYENRAVQFFNNLTEGGQVPAGMIEQLKKELAQAKTRLEAHREMVAKQAYDAVYTAPLVWNVEDNRKNAAAWAGGLFSRKFEQAPAGKPTGETVVGPGGKKLEVIE